MTMLEYLWYGNVSPFEQYLNGNEKYQELFTIMTKDRERLSAGISLQKSEWLEKYDTIISKMHSMAEVEAFKVGFRLACNILYEAKNL